MTSIDLLDKVDASSMMTHIFLFCSIILVNSSFHIPFAMWSTILTAVLREWSSTPISAPFFICSSISSSISENGRLRFAKLYTVLKSLHVDAACFWFNASTHLVIVSAARYFSCCRQILCTFELNAHSFFFGEMLAGLLYFFQML